MSDETKPAPFAVVILTGLRVARFHTKEEFQDAMKTLKADETPFVPVKYHHGAGRYVLPEAYSIEELAF